MDYAQLVAREGEGEEMVAEERVAIGLGWFLGGRFR